MSWPAISNLKNAPKGYLIDSGSREFECGRNFPVNIGLEQREGNGAGTGGLYGAVQGMRYTLHRCCVVGWQGGKNKGRGWCSRWVGSLLERGLHVSPQGSRLASGGIPAGEAEAPGFFRPSLRNGTTALVLHPVGQRKSQRHQCPCNFDARSVPMVFTSCVPLALLSSNSLPRPGVEVVASRGEKGQPSPRPLAFPSAWLFPSPQPCWQASLGLFLLFLFLILGKNKVNVNLKTQNPSPVLIICLYQPVSPGLALPRGCDAEPLGWPACILGPLVLAVGLCGLEGHSSVTSRPLFPSRSINTNVLSCSRLLSPGNSNVGLKISV